MNGRETERERDTERDEAIKSGCSTMFRGEIYVCMSE